MAYYLDILERRQTFEGHYSRLETEETSKPTIHNLKRATVVTNNENSSSTSTDDLKNNTNLPAQGNGNYHKNESADDAPLTPVSNLLLSDAATDYLNSTEPDSIEIGLGHSSVGPTAPITTKTATTTSTDRPRPGPLSQSGRRPAIPSKFVRPYGTIARLSVF